MKDQFLSIDIAEEILNTSISEGQIVFLNLPPDTQSEVFSKLSFERQYHFFLSLEKEFIPIFEEMPSDERNAFYKNLNKEEQINLLPFLKKETRQELLEFLSYPNESAGSIMSTEYTVFHENITVNDVLNHLRQEGKESKLLIYYIYTHDDNLTLTGVTSLRDLLFSSKATLLKEIAHQNIVVSRIFEDQESVAKKIEKYDLLALPIVNTKNQLVGRRIRGGNQAGDEMQQPDVHLPVHPLVPTTRGPTQFRRHTAFSGGSIPQPSPAARNPPDDQGHGH